MLFGLTPTVVVFFALRSARHDSAVSSFRVDLEERLAAIENEIDHSLGAVQSLAKLYEASSIIDRDTFRDLVHITLGQRTGLADTVVFPSQGEILALEWIPYVRASERTVHERQAGEDVAGYEITERGPDGALVRAAERDEYFPVYFVEPIQPNRGALGFDLGSEANRRSALTRARESSALAITAPIQLVQDAEPLASFLAYVPVYADNATGPLAELEGFILGVYRVADIVESALANFPMDDFDAIVIDEAAAEDERLLYTTAHASRSPDLTLLAAHLETTDTRLVGPIVVGSRPWRLVVASADDSLPLGSAAPSWLLLTAGIVATAALALYLALRSRHAVAIGRAQRELEVQTEELRRSNSDLERFAYVASHDLQEPLRMVASYTQLLARRYQGRLDDEADEYIAFAVDGANRMQALIQGLLQFSRITRQASEPQPTDSAEVLRDVCHDITEAIAESGAEISSDALPTIDVDPLQFRTLLQNLILNAIRYRSSDAPRIHVSASYSYLATGWSFSVRDNGIGIDPAYHRRIFEMFQRLHSREEYPGTGVGLALCKKIVQRHRGRIRVESQDGHGTTFHFTIPAGKEAA